MRIRTCQRGFTLIELLTVIAVIAILAALAFPLIQSGNKRAWTAQDLNSMRQIGLAIANYANDNGGVFPNSSIPISGTKLSSDKPDRFIWQEAVDRYLSPPPPNFDAGSAYNYQRRRNIWTSKFAQPYPGYTRRSGVYANPLPIAFGYNYNVDDPNWLGRITRVPNLSKYVLVGENNDTSAIYFFAAPDYVPNKQTGYRVCRPGNTAFYLFCDYHIESLVGDQSEPALKAAGKPNIWKWW